MEGTVKKEMEDDNNLEGEDFLFRLTDEEKECLQYLLETIDSLDQDEDEMVNRDNDTTDQFRNSTEGLPNRDTNLKGLSESVKVLDKSEHTKAFPKMKMVKSYSEDSPGLCITISPDKGQKTTSSHPSHLRKFDTIMRSGVNVQELRARFLHQQGNAPLDDSSTDLSSSSKHIAQASRNPKSPRQEALQKLGLLKRNHITTASTQNTPEAQHSLDHHSSPEKNFELNQNPSANALHSEERKPGGFTRIWPP
ncbi:uncharacterized protein PAF06_000439 [Gastrophryne carolinensis]